MAVLDASVYVALINSEEADHQVSWAWFQRAVSYREPIVAPTILLAEVAAAISRGQGDLELALRVTQRLQKSRIIELIPVSHTLGQQAASIAANYRIRGCDAIYVALARQLGEALVTLDQQQLARGAVVVSTRRPA